MVPEPEIDLSVLWQVLAYIISGPGAGALTVWVMEKAIPDSVASEWRRYISLLLPGAFASGAFGIAVAMGYLPSPQGAKAWIESVFAVWGVACGLAQAIHGRRYLHEAG